MRSLMMYTVLTQLEGPDTTLWGNPAHTYEAWFVGCVHGAQPFLFANVLRELLQWIEH